MSDNLVQTSQTTQSQGDVDLSIESQILPQPSPQIFPLNLDIFPNQNPVLAASQWTSSASLEKQTIAQVTAAENQSLVSDDSVQQILGNVSASNSYDFIGRPGFF